MFLANSTGWATHKVSRLKKFLSLAFHYNLGSAVTVSALAAFLCFCLQAFGVVPLVVPAGERLENPRPTLDNMEVSLLFYLDLRI